MGVKKLDGEVVTLITDLKSANFSKGSNNIKDFLGEDRIVAGSAMLAISC